MYQNLSPASKQSHRSQLLQTYVLSFRVSSFGSVPVFLDFSATVVHIINNLTKQLAVRGGRSGG